jgi:hypothetical protein
MVVVNHGLSFVNRSLRGVITLLNILLVLLIIAALVFYLMGETAGTFVILVWASFTSVLCYSYWSRSRISYIETTADGVIVIYSKFLRVKELLIPYDQVLIQFEKVSGYARGMDTHWIYINQIGKTRFDAEVSGTFYPTAKILELLADDGRIILEERELGIVRHFKSLVADSKTPDTKGWLTTVLLIFLGVLIYVFYKMWSNS